MKVLVKAAEISPCGRYRYTLKRTWGDAKPLLFVMLNPSTADASVDDPTIRRCCSFARREAAGGIVVVNLYALRSTDPCALDVAPNAIGPFNDELIADAAGDADRIVAAWGASLPRGGDVRAGTVMRLLRSKGDVLCLGKTSACFPRHPLYVRGDAPLTLFAARSA